VFGVVVHSITAPRNLAKQSDFAVSHGEAFVKRLQPVLRQSAICDHPGGKLLWTN